MLDALDSDVQVIGTIYGRSAPYADRAKGHSDVEVIPVTREDRDVLVGQIVEHLSGR